MITNVMTLMLISVTTLPLITQWRSLAESIEQETHRYSVL